MIAHFRQRIGEFVDRVVADGNRAMSAGIDGLELIILRCLLADLDRLHHQLAMAVGASAAAFVERERRGNQFGPVLRQPLRTIEGVSGLLAAGQRQLDRALGTVAALLEAHQHIDPGRVHRLHVGCSAAIEVSVFLDQVKGSRVQSSRLASTTSRCPSSSIGFAVFEVPAQDSDQPAVLGMFGIENCDILIGISRRLQVRRHPLGRQRAASR